LKKASDQEGVGCSFGVGTQFTNGEFIIFLSRFLSFLTIYQGSIISIRFPVVFFQLDFKQVEKPIKQEIPGEGSIRSEGETSKAVNHLSFPSLVPLSLSLSRFFHQ
jgi:hypothetical protein